MSTYSQLLEALCTPDHEVTDSDLHELKGILDRVWAKLKIGVAFTNHFAERMNDVRNKKQITVCELADIFIKAFKKFGDKLSHISQREWEAVLTDEQTNVNVPFVLKHDGRQVTMVAKTVMRKPGFYTPDPKLAVASYEPGKTKMGKTFRELTEWVGLNNPDLDTGRAIQAVDDVDTAAFSVETPDVVEKLNAFLQSLCQKQVINPYYILNDIWKKLMIVGLNFDMRAITFMGVEGRVNVPVTQYGGRYGVLGDPESYVSSDSGTRVPGGLILSITFQKNGGIYTLHAQLERGDDTAPFVEAADVSEGQRKNNDISKHWVGTFDRLNAPMKESVTEALLPKPKEPATAHLSPSDRVAAMHQHAQHKVAYWKAIMKHRETKKEDASHALKMLRRAQDSLAIWQMHNQHESHIQEAAAKHLPVFNYILHHPGNDQHGTVKILEAGIANDANRHAKEAGENRIWIKENRFLKKK